MSPEYILKASVRAIGQGRRPHCFSGWVQGRGYVNQGRTAEEMPEYVRQAVRAAQSEVENIGFALAYAEPGYISDAVRGVFLANWNNLPRETPDLIEKLGYGIEWSDEWSSCDECGAIFRLVPNSYCWKPAYKEEDGGLVCCDCARPEETEDAAG